MPRRFLASALSDLSAEEDPLFNLIVRDLDKAGIDPVTLNAP